jgi:predicted permease
MNRPPRLAERLLRIALRGDDAECLLGDLLEAYEQRTARLGGRAARRWFWRQVVTTLWWRGWREPRQCQHDRGRARARRSGGDGVLQGIWNDLRYGARALRRSPTFTFVAAGTLALGIGGSALLFVLVDAILVRPLPFERSDRLVEIQVNTGGPGWYGSSEPEYLDYLELDALSGVAAFSTGMAVLGDTEPPRRLRLARTTANLMPLLGVRALLGRTISAEEDHPDGERVAVLGHGLWQEAFGGRADILGQTLRLDGVPHTVVGVMPPSFAFPTPHHRLWVPLRLDRGEPWTRNNHYLSVIARLADDASIERARAALEALAAESSLRYRDTYPETGYRVKVESALDSVVGGVRAGLLLLSVAVGLVLLIACGNVANLVLWRAHARRGELDLRAALGATRRRVTRQLLAESLVLGASSGVLGVALAAAAGAFLRGHLPPELPRLHEVGVEWRAVLFCVVVTVGATILCGLYPALRAGAVHLGGGSRSARHVAGSSSPWTRRALVVFQLTLAVLLLCSTALVLRSLSALQRVDPGFDPERTLTVEVTAPRRAAPPPASPEAERRDQAATVDFFRRAEEELTRIPGVVAVGALAALPLESGLSGWSLQVEGRVVDDIGEAPAAAVQQATPGSLEAMGLELVAGRFFDESDRAGALPVVVVSESLARELWNGEALGRRMKVFAEEYAWMEVVGIVGDVRQQGLDVAPLPTWYVPHAQAYETAYYSPRTMTVAVRAAGEPSEIARVVLERLRTVDPAAALGEPRELREVVRASTGQPRFLSSLLGAFAATALFLAAVGVYGSLSIGVTLRRREIGVRMALGARRGEVIGSIAAEGALLALAGCVIGLGAGFALRRLLEGVLFGVAPGDPWSLGLSVVVLLAVALGASLAPAWRASRTDPATTLRSE